MKTKRITILALLTTAAMILSYLESMLPAIAVPGVKMGLANIAVIFALYRLGAREALAVSLVRVGMVSMLFGSLSALLYSAAGAALSLAVMAVMRKSGLFSETGVSVAGGVGHNLGQILVAMWMLDSARLIWYLPVLILTGTAGGILTGLTAAMLIRRIPPFEE